MMSATDIQLNIKGEWQEAERKYGPFKSTHEGYGVLAEEVLELLEAIRSNTPERVQYEAVQIAAVAQRIAECVCLPATRERSGMKPPRGATESG